MKALLKVKQVVEYERLYEVECLDDIENEEDLKDLIYDINTNLTLDVSDEQILLNYVLKAKKICLKVYSIVLEKLTKNTEQKRIKYLAI